MEGSAGSPEARRSQTYVCEFLLPRDMGRLTEKSTEIQGFADCRGCQVKILLLNVSVDEREQSQRSAIRRSSAAVTDPVLRWNESSRCSPSTSILPLTTPMVTRVASTSRSVVFPAPETPIRAVSCREGSRVSELPQRVTRRSEKAREAQVEKRIQLTVPGLTHPSTWSRIRRSSPLILISYTTSSH